MKASEFRKDMKKYLDAAVAGQDVFIERGGIKVRLVPNFPKAIPKSEPQGQNTLPEAESQNIMVDPDKRYAVAISETGLPAGKGANNLTYEKAEAFKAKHDVNGEFEIVEQK